MPGIRNTHGFSQHLIFLMAVLGMHAQSGAAEIREQAVVSVAINRLPAGTVAAGTQIADAAAAGQHDDLASLPNGGTVFRSAFVPSGDGKSLLLDSAAKQVLVLPSSPDLSHASAVTVSGFFASLQPLTDRQFYGLFAKRQPAAPSTTNYGINYNPASDALQVYVNDGSGYKVAVFSVKHSIGFRRRTHLAAMFETASAPAPAPAPAPDADSTADAVRIRLYVNGIAATPVSVSGGFAVDTTAWLTDVTLEACQSDTPFVIGGSFPDGELARLICGEVHIFDQALTDEAAQALFQQVAGSAAADILNEQTDPSRMLPSVPTIGRLSQYGLSIGQSSRLTVNGRALADAQLHLGIPGMSAVPVGNSTDQRAEFEITLPAETLPGRYLLRVKTAVAVSAPVIISVDGLPQFAENHFSASNPADTFPLAVSGLISGSEQKRVYFRGTSGQRVVVEVEARRLGSRLDPVVEIRTAESTPLTVRWQQPELSGDARAELILPEDGVYSAEIHDLQFKAPGNNPWRLMIGDLPSASLAYPPAFTTVATELRPVGTSGIGESVSVRAELSTVRLEAGTSLLPLPPLIESTGTEVNEPWEGSFAETPVDATFMSAPFSPLFVNGRISAPEEIDQVLLTVTPGQSLNFSLAARSLSSPLRAEISVFNGETLLGRSDGDSGLNDPALDITVLEGVTQLIVRIRDFTNRGTGASIYRLQVARRDRPAVRLQTTSDTIRLPVNGSAPLKLSVIRQSASWQYSGPIRMRVSGVPGVTIVPDVIPAGDTNQQVLVMLTRSQASPKVATDDIVATEGILIIEGSTEGLEVNVSSRVQMLLQSVPADRLTLREPGLLADQGTAVPGIVTLESAPPILLRGIPAPLNVRVLPLASEPPAFVRFELQTTETPRRSDPDNPNSPLKPMISLPEFQFGNTADSVFSLTLQVPTDVAETTVDALLGTDFVQQPLSPESGSRAWTAPIRLTIDNAVAAALANDTAKGKPGTTVEVAGTLKRHPQFTGSVTVTMQGLPAGYQVNTATVASEEQAFSLTVSIPETVTPAEVPNLSLQLQDSDGNMIALPIPVKLLVE